MMRLTELAAVKLVQCDTAEFYSADLCISLVRYPETRLEFAINRIYKIVQDCEIDLNWVRQLPVQKQTHICISCTRARDTVLIGRIGTICEACFEILYAVYARQFIGFIRGIGDILGFSDYVLVFTAGHVNTYAIRRVFGCIWCLLDIIKKYNNVLDGCDERDRHAPVVQACVICEANGPCSLFQCRNDTYGYCYDCYERANMCIRRFIDKYLLLCECVGSDVSGEVVAYWIGYLIALG